MIHHEGHKNTINMKLPVAWTKKNPLENKPGKKWGPPLTRSVSICQMRDFSREHKGCAGGFLVVRRQAAGEAGERESLCPKSHWEKACYSLTRAGMAPGILHQMLGVSASDGCACLVSPRWALMNITRKDAAWCSYYLSTSPCTSKPTFLLGQQRIEALRLSECECPLLLK